MDLAELGIRVDSSGAVRAVTDLDRLTATAGKAEVATEKLAVSTGKSASAAIVGGNNMRMFGQQLSQVAQQGAATGNYLQALAIQLPDIAGGFSFASSGAAALASGAGILAAIALPALVNALFNSTQGTAEAAAAAERLKSAYDALGEATLTAQNKIDQLRFGVDQEYQVEILREQIRLRDEYNSKVSELNSYLSTTTDNLDRQRIVTADLRAQISTIANKYADNNRLLAEQENRAVQLAILTGQKAQHEAEAAAQARQFAGEAESGAQAVKAINSYAPGPGWLSVAIRQAQTLGGALWDASAAAQSLSFGSGSGNMKLGTGFSEGSSFSMSDGSSVSPYFPKKATGGGSSGGSGGSGGGGGGKSEFEQLVEDLQSQEAAEAESYARRQELIKTQYDQRLITQQTYNQLMQAAEAEHALAMYEIKQQEAEMVRSAAEGMYTSLGDLLGVFSSKSKAAAIAQIALNKGLRIAEIIQNTAAAQMRAFAELGPIAGAAAAAKIAFYGKMQAGIVAATGLAQAASVGGGSAGSIGKTSTAAAAQGATQTANTTVTVYGIDKDQLYTGEMLQKIFDGMLDVAKMRSVKLVFG